MTDFVSELKVKLFSFLHVGTCVCACVSPHIRGCTTTFTLGPTGHNSPISRNPGASSCTGHCSIRHSPNSAIHTTWQRVSQHCDEEKQWQKSGVVQGVLIACTTSVKATWFASSVSAGGAPMQRTIRERCTSCVYTSYSHRTVWMEGPVLLSEILQDHLQPPLRACGSHHLSVQTSRPPRVLLLVRVLLVCQKCARFRFGWRDDEYYNYNTHNTVI